MGRPDRRPRVRGDVPAPGREHRRARRPPARRAARRPLLTSQPLHGRRRLRSVASEQFVEVADRVWVARHEWFDLNITLVGSDRGLLVVDTHASAKAARAVIEDVRRLGAGDVVGHRQHPRALRPHLRQRRVPRDVRRGPDARARGRGGEHRLRRRVDQGRLPRGARRPARATRSARPRSCRPDHTFSSAVALDLGDRAVELVHPGRGHTAATWWCGCPMSTW